MQIDFEVEGQRLILTSESYIVADSLNFIKIKAVFSSDWDCLTKFAVFNRDSNTYEILLDAENSCIIPCECVAEEGEFYISFIGINDAGRTIIATTKEKTLVVKGNEFSDRIGSGEMRLTLTYLGEVLAKVKEGITASDDAKAHKEAAAKSADAAKMSETTAKTASESAEKSAAAAAESAKQSEASAKGVAEAESNAKKYADEAKKQAETAAASATAAGDSEALATESANAADNSEKTATAAKDMAIEAAKSSLVAATSADESAKAAAASAKGIGEAEQRAATSAKAASDSAEAAASSATAAAGSESKVNRDKLAAETAANAASASETKAGQSAENAANSEKAASESADAAVQAETAAAESAKQSAVSAENADTAKTQAAVSASKAQASETAAGASAVNAKTSETNSAASSLAAAEASSASAASVSAVEAAKSAAATSAANAKASESNAANSATAADTSANNASVSAAAAVESKIAAAESENNANTFKNLAQESATTAAGSASTATSEANRAKAEADRAVEAAEQAAAGGVRKVNGISPDAEGNVNVPEYEHPSSGVTAGTYRSVTVNAQGHIIGGSNPNTLAGYGITDAKITGGVITLGGDTITPLTAGSAIDASKLTGVVKIENLPPTVIERIKTVEDDAARFALTTAIVQNGDSVKVVETNLMYYVKDDTKLGSEDGYEVYTAGAAASVPWSGVTDLPATFAPSAHNHKGSEITLTGYIKAETATEIKDTDNLNVAVGKLEKMIEGKQATGDYALSDHSHDVMIGAGASATGTAGFVPAPAAGKQDSFLKGDGTWQYPPNNKVTQTVVSDNAEYPLLLAIRANQTANTTDEVCFAISAKFNPATKTLTLDKFKGALIGNADSSTKAEQDSDGNNIITTYSTKTELAEKANKATTLAGYGITDAKILNGEISLGGNKIKPLTQHQDLSAYAKLASPNFTEIPTAPTAVAGTNTHQLANTAFVQQELKNYVKTTTENTFSNKNTFEKTITTISDFQTYEEVTDDKTLTADSANWQIVTLAKDITLTIDNSNMVLGKIKVYQVQVTTGIVAAVNGYKLKIATNAGLIASPIFYPNGEIPILQEQQGLLLTITVTSDLMHGIFCYVGTVCDGLEG
jgi:hypothetical protein|nr:MAG TPA: hypothetical protein [Caudoviricetes sp.]